MNTIKIMMMGDWGFHRRTNMIKITIMMLGPHLMMITKRRTLVEGRVRPTLECFGNKDHDENLLHTITLLAQHMVESIIDFFQ
jgi:hypothetical protein